MATITIPLTNLHNGTATFGPATIADTDSQAELQIDRTVTNGLNSKTTATTIALAIEESTDGGTTWVQIASALILGGPADPLPSKFTPGFSFVGCTFAPGTGRQVRASTTTTNGPVSVQGTLTSS